MLDTLSMPPAGGIDETEEQKRARLISNTMPPAGTPAPPQPSANAMPPAGTPQPATPSLSMPPAGQPSQPSPAPANAMPPAPVQKPQEQPPELHGWKKYLDAIGSIFPIGRAIETGIPGTPQNWELNQAKQAERDQQAAEIANKKQATASEASRTGISEQESKLVAVPNHPEMGLVEQKNLAAIEKQLAANSGRVDVADITQTGENKRAEERINASKTGPAAVKMGLLKPDILAQVPMPENGTPEEMAAWGKKYDELAAKAGQKQTGLGTYSMVRLLDWASKYDPEVLKGLPDILKGAGIAVPPGVAGGIPEGQPLSPETGHPIGTAMPGAPTAPTRTQAQVAARVITELPDIKKEVAANAKYLGPGEGRLNVAFLLGKVGSTGDPAKDRALNKLRTDMMFLSGAAAKFHLNSVRAVEGFQTLANAGKDSTAALNGFLDSIAEWASTAQKQERGFGETGATTGPPAPQPGMKVQSRTVNGKTEYRQVPLK